MARMLHEIAQDVRDNWRTKDGHPAVKYSAEPYLQAMECLYGIDGNYGMDRASDIVRYFLSNATTFRGEDARRIKAELQGML